MKRFTETILEKLNTLVVVVNQLGKVEYVSPAAKKILGYNPDELLGEGWWELTRETVAERADVKQFVGHLIAKEAVRNSASESISYSYERVLTASNGDKKWILWNTTPGPDGFVIGLGQDITDRKKAELELAKKNELLEKKNTEINDSIQYARRIQEAILPDPEVIRRSFADASVFYAPKDVVSGDFYWYFKKDDLVFLGAIDCTGHGVPGAMMSVLANSLLRDIVIKRDVFEPGEILLQLDIELYNALHSSGNGQEYREGMDIALMAYNHSTKLVKFAGAMRPLVRIKDGEVNEVKGNRFPIGSFTGSIKPFDQSEFHLEEDESLYMFSDGFADQFGGEKNKKLNRKRFYELLSTASMMTGEEQEAYLEYALRNWKQDEEQTDDILVLGVRG
jgi:PAS domain S-box-containing protein